MGLSNTIKQALLAGTIWLLAVPLPASALCWGVGVEDTGPLGQSAYGTQGWNRAIGNPQSVVHDAHVNSIYVRSHVRNAQGRPQYDAEVGWVSWDRNGENFDLRSFAAKWDFFDYSLKVFGGGPPEGENVIYKVERHANPRTWWFYENNSRLYPPAGFDTYRDTWTGFSLVASERNNKNTDTSYAHFWSIKKRNKTGTWYNWASPAVWDDTDNASFASIRSSTELYILNQFPVPTPFTCN